MSKYNKLLIICVIISGCYTQKSALNQLQKAQLKHPDVVAKFAGEQYPINVSKIDTVMMFDTGYVMVPVYNTDTIIDTLKLTNIGKTNIVKQDKIKVITKVVTITKSIIDSAKVSDLSYQLSQCKADKDTIKDKRNTYIFWLLIALCCSLFANLVIYILK